VQITVVEPSVSTDGRLRCRISFTKTAYSRSSDEASKRFAGLIAFHPQTQSSVKLGNNLFLRKKG